MDRRKYLAGLSTAAVVGLAGCTDLISGGGGGGSGQTLLEIRDSTLRETDDGDIVISGSVENVSDEELVAVTVLAELFDPDGNPIHDDEIDYPRAAVGGDGTIQAGETSTFDIDTEQNSVDDISDYELLFGDLTQP